MPHHAAAPALGACWWGDLKHAAACHSVCCWPLLVGGLKHAAACRSMPQHTESCSLLPLAFGLSGHMLTHDRLSMSKEMLRHLAIVCVNNMDKERKCAEEE